MSRVFVGTSGWQYRQWKGPVYPRDLDPEKWLEHYASRFDSVEVNNSFYRLPDKETFRRWKRDVSGTFVFAVKANRYITHMKKLKDPEEPIGRLVNHAAVLGKRLGPILFQLPPNWGFDKDRLERFLSALPGKYRWAFEFRDRSWICDQALELLAKREAAFCIYELDGWRSPIELTADFSYIRLHGPHEPYKGRYHGRTIGWWAERIEEWKKKRRDVYLYFDNDEDGHAAEDAARLLHALGR